MSLLNRISWLRAGRGSAFHTGMVAAAILLALPGALSGCSGKSVNDKDPSALYDDAMEDIKSDHYQIALEKLRTVKNKFPYSKVAVDAQLKIADVYFAQEQWAEAASSYETFRDLHPRHEKVAYAMFRAAKSYFNDIPDPIARDLTPAQKAVDAYRDFLRQYPAAAEAEEAKKDLAKAREDLAGKELYIAEFYYKRDFFESAKGRYEKILEQYPETQAATQAKTRLASIEEYLSKTRKEGAQNGGSNSNSTIGY